MPCRALSATRASSRRDAALRRTTAARAAASSRADVSITIALTPAEFHPTNLARAARGQHRRGFSAQHQASFSITVLRTIACGTGIASSSSFDERLAALPAPWRLLQSAAAPQAPVPIQQHQRRPAPSATRKVQGPSGGPLGGCQEPSLGRDGPAEISGHQRVWQGKVLSWGSAVSNTKRSSSDWAASTRSKGSRWGWL